MPDSLQVEEAPREAAAHHLGWGLGTFSRPHLQVRESYRVQYHFHMWWAAGEHG